MLKARRAEVARDGRLFRPRGSAEAHAPRGELLQFGKRDTDGFAVGLAQAFIAKCDGEQRNAFRCRALEVEEYDSSIAGARRKFAPSQRVAIAAQTLKRLVVGTDGSTSEAEALRRLPHPSSRDRLFFCVVVVRRQMICEVGRTVAEFRHREHSRTLPAVRSGTKWRGFTLLATSVKTRTMLRLPKGKRNRKSVIPVVLESLARAALEPEIKSTGSGLTKDGIGFVARRAGFKPLGHKAMLCECTLFEHGKVNLL